MREGPTPVTLRTKTLLTRPTYRSLSPRTSLTQAQGPICYTPKSRTTQTLVCLEQDSSVFPRTCAGCATPGSLFKQLFICSHLFLSRDPRRSFLSSTAAARIHPFRITPGSLFKQLCICSHPIYSRFIADTHSWTRTPALLSAYRRTTWLPGWPTTRSRSTVRTSVGSRAPRRASKNGKMWPHRRRAALVRCRACLAASDSKDAAHFFGCPVCGAQTVTRHYRRGCA